MWFDGAIAVILIFTIVQGFRRGFVHTFVHTAGWLLAVVLGFVWYPRVLDYLKNNTGIYNSIHDRITARIIENADSASNTTLSNIPEVIREILEKAIDSATDTIALTLSESLSRLVFAILAFLLVVLAIKLILLFITTLLSKKKNSGILGGIDGFLGLLSGALKGIVIVYILLALIVPITGLWGNTVLIDELNKSTIGLYLYDNNLILWAVRDFLAP